MRRVYRRSMWFNANGFSLIELMIAVAIIAILAAIAVPNYAQHTVKARNAAAKAFLMDIAQRQEQYLLDNRSYASTLADLLPGMAAADRIPLDVSKFYNAPTEPFCAAPCTTYQVAVTPIAGGKMDGTGAYQGTLVITSANPSASISN